MENYFFTFEIVLDSDLIVILYNQYIDANRQTPSNPQNYMVHQRRKLFFCFVVAYLWI